MCFYFIPYKIILHCIIIFNILLGIFFSFYFFFRAGHRYDDDDDFIFDSDSDSSQKAQHNLAILLGPSGCGKTSTVYAVANELNANVKLFLIFMITFPIEILHFTF